MTPRASRPVAATLEVSYAPGEVAVALMDLLLGSEGRRGLLIGDRAGAATLVDLEDREVVAPAACGRILAMTYLYADDIGGRDVLRDLTEDERGLVLLARGSGYDVVVPGSAP